MDMLPNEISDAVFRRVTRRDPGEFSLDGQMLNVLVELDGRKNIAVVSKKTGLPLTTLKDIISRLLEVKLIEPVDDGIELLDRGFFDYFNVQLSLATGPIAEILIEDAVSDLGFNSSSFPSHHAAELVDMLARQVRREKKRTSFQRAMVLKIRELIP
jgi:hypothetical protein